MKLIIHFHILYIKKCLTYVCKKNPSIWCFKTKTTLKPKSQILFINFNQLLCIISGTFEISKAFFGNNMYESLVFSSLDMCLF